MYRVAQIACSNGVSPVTKRDRKNLTTTSRVFFSDISNVTYDILRKQ